MIRDLILLPGVPRRALDDLDEMKELLRQLLPEVRELTTHSASTDRKVTGLETTNRLLVEALEVLRGLNENTERLNRGLAGVQAELRAVRKGVEEIATAVPDLNRGALGKVKDALSGEG